MKIPQLFRIKGMNQQISPSLQQGEYAYENRNVRIVSQDDNTVFSIVNEKGNIQITSEDGNDLICGTPIGVISAPNCEESEDDGKVSNGFVIFTTEDKEDATYDDQNNPVVVNIHTDRIYLIVDTNNNGSLQSKLLFEGNLNFSTSYPIEGIYDSNAKSKKIYWTDNYNEVRHMPIENLPFPLDNSYNTSFNTEIVDIKVDISRIDSGGIFPSGVRQYIITAFQKYGAETSPLYVSPLMYCSQKDRGLAPDENVTCSYNIKVTVPNVFNEHYWLCIYAIHRTSQDQSVSAYKVREIQIPKTETSDITISVLDIGNNESVDISELLYKDTQEIKCKTISHKDNTLFLGNITVNNSLNLKDEHYYMLSQTEDIEDGDGESKKVPIIEFKDTLDIPQNNYGLDYADLFQEPQQHTVNLGNLQDYYPYENQLFNARRYLKRGEEYRLGLQFQDKFGKWSEPVYVRDVIPTGIITTNMDSDFEVTANLPKFYLDLFEYKTYAYDPNNLKPYKLKDKNREWIQAYLDLGYIKVRPVVVYPNIYQRRVLCQGMLQYTASNAKDTTNNMPYCQSLWLARPTFNPNANDSGVVNGYYFPSFNEINNGTWTVPNNTIADLPRQLIGTYGGLNKSAGGLPEIQTSYVGSSGKENTDNSLRESLAKEDKIDTGTLAAAHPEIFFLQPQVITFHSPDIEITKDLHSAELQDYHLSVVGYHVVQNYYTNIDITTSTGPSLLKGSVPAEGFKRKAYQEKSGSFNTGNKNYWNGLPSYGHLVHRYYQDALKEPGEANYTDQVYPSIYLWQAGGSLSGDVITEDNPSPASTLTSKKFLYATSSLRTIYTKQINSYGESAISDIQIFKDDGNPLIVLKKKSEDSATVNYYGQVDTLVPFDLGRGDWKDVIEGAGDMRSYRNTKKYGYPVLGSKIKDEAGFSQELLANPNTYGIIQDEENPLFYFHTLELLQGNQLDNEEGPYSKVPYLQIYTSLGQSQVKAQQGYEPAMWVNGFKKDPVLMRYKSSPHIVISLSSDYNMVQGKYWGYRYGRESSESKSFINPLYGTNQPSNWSNSISVNYGTSSGQGEHDTDICNMVLMAELRRNDVGQESIFGGTTRQELQVHQWLPCGKSIMLKDLLEEITYIEGTNQGDWKRPKTFIVINDGDTYFQKYDCLKTYPISTEDENALINIHSFMCETRINMDGRYDKNRGTDSLVIDTSNFNLHNPVYNQANNFYNYQVFLEEQEFKYSHYPCQITWSKSKLPNDRIDAWTNITLGSVLEIDGEKGPINKIIKSNNDLLVFQDDGVSKLLYNENAMLSTKSGIPIELANSGKVTGNHYISNSTGAKVREAVINANNTVYFIDAYGKTLNTIQKDTIVPLSQLKMQPWFYKQQYYNDWDPIAFSNLILQYDDVNKEVMIINKQESLSYNTQLNEFTSFYDYGDTPYFVNLNGYLYAVRKDGKIYKQYEGDYNKIFDIDRPFSIELIANGGIKESQAQQNKLWDNIEIISDNNSIESSPYNYSQTPFTSIGVITDYQMAQVQPINIKKKFNTWRVQLPRAIKIDKESRTTKIRDRIRSMWAKIKLINDGSIPNKTIIRDVIINSYL